MIEKMKFLSITGPKNDIDRVVEAYLSKYEFHLENALSELKNIRNLRPFQEVNPYVDSLKKADEYLGLLQTESTEEMPNMTFEEAKDFINQLETCINTLRKDRMELEDKRTHIEGLIRDIDPFREIHYNIREILHFKFIKYRFGKIPYEYYRKFEKYIYDTMDTIFLKCHYDADYVWGVYFVTLPKTSKIDAIYTSMHFERLYLPDEYSGTPEEAFEALKKEMSSLTTQIASITDKINEKLRSEESKLLAAKNKLQTLSDNFEVRKLAACTSKEKRVYYILCGWLSVKDADALIEETSKDERVYCLAEDDHDNIFSKPPTKLKNPKIFRPFEMFVRMYGLPAHNEMDPTIFVALTYSLIFGAMFGDVGQGLCLVAGGLLLYGFKKIDLAAAISCAGIFSTIFGFLYGSFFGFEEVLPAVWLRPTTAMSNLPFIGMLNTVFIVAVAFGMFLILFTMILHIINGIRAKDPKSTWLDSNGLAGFVFYGSAVTIIVLYMTGRPLPATIVLVMMFVIPLLLIALKEPIARIIEKKRNIQHESKVMFILETFFELFEVILSYFSNTISFVRIGAFAVSHAAMMEVVLMLAGASEGGSPNWIIIVIGNIFVCLMEGLIVGIQVLRLEYYEMFIRFYKGNGRPFRPFIAKRNK